MNPASRGSDERQGQNINKEIPNFNGQKYEQIFKIKLCDDINRHVDIRSNINIVLEESKMGQGDDGLAIT